MFLSQPFYRCPQCGSYDTVLELDRTTVRCLRCRRSSPVHRFRLRFMLRDQLSWEIVLILAFICLASACGAFGSIVVRDDARMLYLQPTDFERARGTIVSAEIIERAGEDGKTNYAYHIQYTYQVGTRIYEADRVSFGFTSSSERTFAETYVRTYAVGTDVTVFYLPADPDYAVLEPANRAAIDQAIFFAVCWLGIALFLPCSALLWMVFFRPDG